MAFLSDYWVGSWRKTLPVTDFQAWRGRLTAFLHRSGARTLVAEDGNSLAAFVTL